MAITQNLKMRTSIIACALLFVQTVLGAQSYQLDTSYSGTNFFTGWNFLTGADPTHGYVSYQDQSSAASAGLINTNNGVATMGVDSKNVLDPNGAGRKSVRITTQKQWTKGLFIADIAHMPDSACGSWPAFWMWSANPNAQVNNWPSGGEIDIIEGVNSQAKNQMALHTTPNCVMTPGTMTGSVRDMNCDGTQNGNAGCGISSNDATSYGTGFNSVTGGGVYAAEWTSDYIKIWYFPRNNIPSDITSGAPVPSGWSNPTAYYSGGSGCNIDSHFSAMSIVFDTTFCGDWAGNVWGSDSTCASKASSCVNYVAGNPSAFANTYWAVNSVKVYQLGTTPTPTQPNPPAQTTLPANSGWNALGCYSDSSSSRTLTTRMGVDGGDSTQSIERCQNACKAAGFAYAGLEYASECYCGNSLMGPLASDGSAQCNMACKGNSQEICGGPNRLNIFQQATTVNNAWNSVGCYVDNPNARTLNQRTAVSGGDGSMTIEKCQSACYALGYKYSGLEYAQQCFCDTAIRNSAAMAPEGASGCNMKCLGNSAETCGAGNRIQLYMYSGSISTTTGVSVWSPLGCYTDSSSARTLATRVTVSGGDGATSIDSCTTTCGNSGYSYSGAEYGGECYCANSLTNGGTSVSDGCTMKCNGNNAQICGGSNRLSLYQSQTWYSLGCYSDSSSARTLTTRVTVPGGDGATSVSSCEATCGGKGFSYAGVEYGGECYCGNSIANGGQPATDGCTMACNGNGGQVCGGGNRINVYQTR